MLKRLNGWQRIWVVIAGIGILVAAYWSLSEAHSQFAVNGAVLAGFSDPQCKYIVDLPPRYKLDELPGYDSPCWDLHLYRSIYEGARNTSDGYVEHMVSLQRTSALQLFGVSLIAWAICMGLLYAVGAIVAWVVRGFQAKPA